jgi:hypothetical protein
MNGLAGARVIVVDDQESEALPILRAFAKKGVPIAFFDGNPEGLPTELLTGVRLAILDMDLIGGGVPDRSKVSALVGCLKGILKNDNGPFTVIAWTYHAELFNLFERTVFSEKDLPKPILSLMLTKAECKDADGDFSLSVISHKLREALSEFSPLFFLQRWEGKCFQAATEVTNGLSTLVSPQTRNRTRYRQDWKGQFLQLLHAMAKAQVDQHLDPSTCLDAVYSSLGPLYADRMETHAVTLSSELDPQEILGALGDCGNEKKAKINTMLHLAFEGLERFTGGNIYMFPNKKRPKWLPESRQLIEDFVQGKSGLPGTVTKINHLADINIPILIEINANCDHAQKNIRVSRFLFGLVLPANERSKINPKAGFIWEFGPLFLKGKRGIRGEYNIYFSSRHLISIKLESARRMSPFARLRGQALVDLQAWFARHAARPGMVLLR